LKAQANPVKKKVTAENSVAIMGKLSGNASCAPDKKESRGLDKPEGRGGGDKDGVFEYRAASRLVIFGRCPIGEDIFARKDVLSQLEKGVSILGKKDHGVADRAFFKGQRIETREVRIWKGNEMSTTDRIVGGPSLGGGKAFKKVSEGVFATHAPEL